MTNQRARYEADRCLYCYEAPCTAACPVHIDIPGFIAMIRSGNLRGAAEVVKRANALANVCGNICPEEVFCQPVCNRSAIDSPIRIRELHHYATHDEAVRGFTPLRTFQRVEKRVAVVGGGPAGISCAFELSKMGYAATIFDKNGLGGVPGSSIPAARLPDSELQADLRFLSDQFTVRRQKINDAGLMKLRNHFDAIFLAVGLGMDRALVIPGEHLAGVVPVLKFLEQARSNRGRISVGKNVVVVGGGNVSLDAAATAKRLKASSVKLIYRRGEQEMKVWTSELGEARRLGVEFSFLTLPVEIVGDNSGRVRGVRCRKTRLSGKRDASGRPIPVEIEGSEHVIPAETVIIAIGQDIPEGLFAEVARTRRGYLRVDKKFQTSVPGIFAGGDAIAGEGTIVQSVAQGKEAARSIHGYLAKKRPASSGKRATRRPRKG
jgi:dihydropyrimidine dehydrogenase (NAD+) subunit PreT